MSDQYLQFSEKIDCKFPYNDEDQSSRLILEGRSICLDADFLVLKEICSKGRSVQVTRKRQHELVDEWAAGFKHQLKEPLLRCARLQIDGKKLPWREAVSLMAEIGQFNAQYAALSIVYFAGESDSDEGEAELEAGYERICRVWSEENANRAAR